MKEYNELKRLVKLSRGLTDRGLTSLATKIDELAVKLEDEFNEDSAIEFKGETMTKRELEEKIIKLRKDYWDGNCTTPDHEYDELVELLRSIDPKNPLLVKPEHGESTRKKVYHDTPMLSLQKVYNKEDLFKWIESVSRSDDEEFLVQPKYDGISCFFSYGSYSTRGDGNVGEDITDVCLSMCKHDLQDGYDDKPEFYGELLIKKTDFRDVFCKIHRPNGESFKTPRNAVAGIVNADDYMYYARQGSVLTLVDYDKYSLRMKKSEFELKWDFFKGYINALNYPMDGIVVKIADPYWRENQGYTEHHPKGAMAFKFENATATTRLKRIEWGMGKEFITATAVFEPVVLNGVTVSRAVVPMKSLTLPCIMNYDYNIDAELTVERAGDVIPHITSVKPAATSEFFVIDKCPFCGANIEVLNSGVRCTNPECSKKVIHRIYDSLVQLGIKNVGESTVSAVCSLTLKPSLHWWMSTVPYIMGKIVMLDGFGVSSAKSVCDETSKLFDTTMEKYIAAMGIPNVGTKIGQVIGSRYHTFEEFFHRANYIDLSRLEGIGDTMAERIMDWLETDAAKEAKELSKMFKFKSTVSDSSDTKGTVCFTGAMRMKRSEMQRIAREAGYTPIDSVTKDLDLLVVADTSDLSSSKSVKAKKYGIETMTEEEFLGKCGY